MLDFSRFFLGISNVALVMLNEVLEILLIRVRPRFKDSPIFIGCKGNNKKRKNEQKVLKILTFFKFLSKKEELFSNVFFKSGSDPDLNILLTFYIELAR